MLLTPRSLFFLFSAAGALAIAGALLAQYAAGLAPCHLCLLQRVPHTILAFAGLVLACTAHTRRRRHLGLYFLAATCAVGAGIALYHTAVEAGWITSGCVTTAAGSESLDAIRARLSAAPRVSCDEAMATLFGLSMAAWNALYSGTLALCALYFARTR